MNVAVRAVLPAGERGFTLIETLVAMTVMALLMTALFEVFSGALSALARSESRSAAVLLAESRLAELSGAEQIRRGDLRGRVEQADGLVLEWRSTATPYGSDEFGGDAKSEYRLYSTRVEVRWRERGLGQGALSIAGGKLLLTTSEGELAVAEEENMGGGEIAGSRRSHRASSRRPSGRGKGGPPGGARAGCRAGDPASRNRGRRCATRPP